MKTLLAYLSIIALFGLVVAQSNSPLEELAVQTTILGQGNPASAIALSPNGQFLAGAMGLSNSDSILTVWDYATTNVVQSRDIRIDYSLPQLVDSSVRTIAFGSDSQTIAWGNGNKEVGVYNLRTKQDLWVLKAHKDAVTTVSLSLDGKQFASGSLDGQAKLFNAKTGQLLGTLTNAKQGSLRSLVYNKQNSMLATGYGTGQVVIWNHVTQQKIRRFPAHTGILNAVAFGPNGRLIATCGVDLAARIFDLNGRKLFALKGHTKSVTSVVFSSDAKLVLTGSLDGTARLWDAQTGVQKAVLNIPNGVTSNLVFSSNNKSILIGGQQGIEEWLISSLAPFKEFKDFSGAAPSTFAFSQNGQALISGQHNGAVNLWQATGEHLRQFSGHQAQSVYGSVFMNDNTIVTSGYDGFVRFWDQTTGLQKKQIDIKDFGELSYNLRDFRPSMGDLSVSADQSTLAVTVASKNSLYFGYVHSVLIWKANADTSIHSNFRVAQNATHPVLNSDGSRLLAVSSGANQYWNLTDENINPFQLTQNDIYVDGMVFSPDEKLIVAYGRRYQFKDKPGGFQIWNTETQETIFLGSLLDLVQTLAFSPNGKIFATSDASGRLTFWETSSFKVLLEITNENTNIQTIAFSSDGARVAVGGDEIRIYATPDFKVLFN